MPFVYLLLLFTVVPLVEFSLLVRIHDHIGLFWTILLVLGTGVLGASLAKRQGVLTLLKIRGQMAEGHVPGDALVDGFLILVAGALLITPGVMTDAVGFSLLVPPLRSLIKAGLRRHFAGRIQVHTNLTGAAFGERQDDVVDAEVIETHVYRE
ncbi:MAG: FxsA family protein [Planctomycetales bacterium]|nr:FxsA family protein [Planctomycetales bacterium]